MNKVDKSNYNSIVYISHPYGGKQENLDNINECQRILTQLHPENLYLNPVAMFSSLYEITDYETGLNMTLFLLEELADEMLVCSDNYMKSRGCVSEITYCDKRNIPYKFTNIQQLKKMLQKK